MKEGTSSVPTSTVREFIRTITAQAKAATNGHEQSGLLQLSRLHPTSEDLVPSRFTLDDVEHMIRAAVDDSEAGHNVYIEGRTVRRDLRGNARGKLTDTAAVFALVVDSDADKQMGWIPSPTTRPSMTVETSPGNHQYWLFLREAISPELAQKLGERIRRAVNSDHDTGNPVQPYRVAGTTNYPSPKKIQRGRVIVPTRLVEFDPEILWTPEDIEQAFPLSDSPRDDGGGKGEQADETDVPADTMKAIRNGVADGRDRSHVFWNVVVALKRLGFTPNGIVDLLERYPDGIAKKYEGRLRQEVERAYNKIRGGSQPEQTQAAHIEPEISAKELEAMTFPPIKWVVPNVICEGLTLFASKPKLGKSWLLLHAAIAVATGGFTLGEIHCKEGDVLYCALEDGLRRLRSRMEKLKLSYPERLTFRYQLPKLSMGGVDVLREWITRHPDARLIIIDILAMVRESRKSEQTTYDADYQTVVDLRNLAIEFGIAIVVVHHLRKADSEDAFDTVSGTLGLIGAPDTILIIKRDLSGKCVLHGRGRDLIEIEKAISFDRDACLWRIEGDAEPIRRSAERTQIIDAITEAGQPIGPSDIATATGMKSGNVRRLLGKLVKDGVIERAEKYGRYRPKSDDLPYTGPQVDVPDQGEDPLDEHGRPKSA
jgi:hypothetical protein